MRKHHLTYSARNVRSPCDQNIDKLCSDISAVRRSRKKWFVQYGLYGKGNLHLQTHHRTHTVLIHGDAI